MEKMEKMKKNLEIVILQKPLILEKHLSLLRKFLFYLSKPKSIVEEATVLKDINIWEVMDSMNNSTDPKFQDWVRERFNAYYINYVKRRRPDPFERETFWNIAKNGLPVVFPIVIPMSIFGTVRKFFKFKNRLYASRNGLPDDPDDHDDDDDPFLELLEWLYNDIKNMAEDLSTNKKAIVCLSALVSSSIFAYYNRKAVKKTAEEIANQTKILYFKIMDYFI